MVYKLREKYRKRKSAEYPMLKKANNWRFSGNLSKDLFPLSLARYLGSNKANYNSRPKKQIFGGNSHLLCVH